MIEVELVGQMSCWCLNLELFNTNAMFGKMLNFEQRRDMVKLASKTIAQVPWRVLRLHADTKGKHALSLSAVLRVFVI